jgi:hypothetical protein
MTKEEFDRDWPMFEKQCTKHYHGEYVVELNESQYNSARDAIRDRIQKSKIDHDDYIDRELEKQKGE